MNFGKDIINIDLECTSSDRYKGSICEIGAVLMNKDSLNIYSEFQSLIKPYRYYFEEKAMKCHGITIEELNKAPALEQVLNNFQSWIIKDGKKRNEKEVYLMAFGAYFDIKYLNEAYNFLNRVWPFDFRDWDIKGILRWEYGLQGIPYKGGLQTISKALGIPFEGTAHRALADARQGALILKEIARLRINKLPLPKLR